MASKFRKEKKRKKIKHVGKECKAKSNTISIYHEKMQIFVSFNGKFEKSSSTLHPSPVPFVCMKKRQKNTAAALLTQ